MPYEALKIVNKKAILRFRGPLCESADELFASVGFKKFIEASINKLKKKHSYLLGIFDSSDIGHKEIQDLIESLKLLVSLEGDDVVKIVPGAEPFFRDKTLFNNFVEYLYDNWRDLDRFAICEGEPHSPGQKPYRTFNNTVENLTHLLRSIYRDIQENITGSHPTIYRQIPAGAEMAAIALPQNIPFPDPLYKKLQTVPVISQMLMYPPMVLDPPMNRRSGRFERIYENLVPEIPIRPKEWLCYPAKVGELIILIYFHEQFYELGFSLCNLFELADWKDLQRKPDAIYLFGVDEKVFENKSFSRTVFYDDEENDMMVATVPYSREFGYFGYLKKMVLTLHNIIMMKRGHFPFHGALVKMIMEGDVESTILMIGDTGAGKSETLEAFQLIAEEYIQDMIIVADDMGSLQADEEGNIKAYGTEIGAFLRLDDLAPGYAFGHIDRSIIMSAGKVNARIVLPVANFEEVIKGHKLDYVFYLNNYEEIDDEHPVIENISSVSEALRIFREGTVMSKGTTTSTGLVHSYFANIFGPPQYRELHDKVADKFFHLFDKNDVYVGQIRSRLGISGFERKGPEIAAKDLLELLRKKKKS